MKVWDQAVIELATPGSAVRLVSVARHITHCATWPGILQGLFISMKNCIVVTDVDKMLHVPAESVM